MASNWLRNACNCNLIGFINYGTIIGHIFGILAFIGFSYTFGKTCTLWLDIICVISNSTIYNYVKLRKEEIVIVVKISHQGFILRYIIAKQTITEQNGNIAQILFVNNSKRWNIWNTHYNHDLNKTISLEVKNKLFYLLIAKSIEKTCSIF